MSYMLSFVAPSNVTNLKNMSKHIIIILESIFLQFVHNFHKYFIVLVLTERT
jgi:hypothetical protein